MVTFAKSAIRRDAKRNARISTRETALEVSCANTQACLPSQEQHGLAENTLHACGVREQGTLTAMKATGYASANRHNKTMEINDQKLTAAEILALALKPTKPAKRRAK